MEDGIGLGGIDLLAVGDEGQAIMAKYHKHWDIKPFAFDPPGDWEHGEWRDVRKVWFHRVEKNDLYFGEYCFTEHPFPGFYARAADAFRMRARR